MTTLIDQVLAVAGVYAEAEGIDLPRTSWRSFRETKTLVDLAAGRTSPTLKRADQAMLWFSRNWPAGALWPDDVPRPHGPADPVASDTPPPPPASPANGAAGISAEARADA